MHVVDGLCGCFLNSDQYHSRFSFLKAPAIYAKAQFTEGHGLMLKFFGIFPKAKPAKLILAEIMAVAGRLSSHLTTLKKFLTAEGSIKSLRRQHSAQPFLQIVSQ